MDKPRFYYSKDISEYDGFQKKKKKSKFVLKIHFCLILVYFITEISGNLCILYDLTVFSDSKAT